MVDMRKPNPYKLHLMISALLLVVVNVCGCSSTLPPQGALYQRLKDRGPVLLSADNPYLPANRLLSEELNASAQLREFVSRRGAPAALQVNQGVLERTELSLIYPAEDEVYRMVKRSKGWVIGAPEPLDDDALKQIEDELALGGMTLTDTRNSGSYVAAILPHTNEQDEESAYDRASLSGNFEEEIELPKVRSAKRVPNPNRGEAPIKVSKSKGLIHTVSFPGESLSVLATWYTGAASNLYAIARANGVDPRSSVKLGQSVTIPPKLLKNKRPLTQGALRRLTYSR
jgi:hypothetical protein